MRDFNDLKRFAEAQGFHVTSTTGGAHNAGSLHFRGLAIDVRTRGKANAEIERFMRRCTALGVRVRDERFKPRGQTVWSGAHLHLEITPNTSEAVRRFQSARNLHADGIVGKQTLAALAAIL